MAKARFNFGVKESPEYNPFGRTFTERQEQIIRGVSQDTVTKNQLTVIMRKAEKLGCPEVAQQIYEMYEAVFTGPNDGCKYTIDEAKAILESLTPWRVPW